MKVAVLGPVIGIFVVLTTIGSAAEEKPKKPCAIAGTEKYILYLNTTPVALFADVKKLSDNTVRFEKGIMPYGPFLDEWKVQGGKPPEGVRWVDFDALVFPLNADLSVAPKGEELLRTQVKKVVSEPTTQPSCLWIEELEISAVSIQDFVETN